MEDLYYNLDSIQSQYGENVLTAVIQMDERIRDVASYFPTHDALNDFEKLQVADRLQQMAVLNAKIQHELDIQLQKITSIQDSLTSVVTPG